MISKFLAAVPSFVTAGILLYTLSEPMFLDGSWVYVSSPLFVFEFLVAHSGGAVLACLLGFKSKNNRITVFTILMLIYVPFIYIMTTIVGLWFTSAFVVITCQRVWTLLKLTKDKDITQIVVRWISNFLILLFGIPLALLLTIDPIPSEILQKIPKINASGDWIDKPSEGLVAMAIFYLLMGIAEWVIPVISKKIGRANSRKFSF